MGSRQEADSEWWGFWNAVIGSAALHVAFWIAVWNYVN